MKKILLTTVFKPFGIENKYNKKGDDLLLDFLASRLTREPGLFPLSSRIPNSGLHLIAANLPAASKVMEYPTEQEFLAELKQCYDYLGISFIIKGYRKVFRMISLARKYAPGTKIVIGGFGTGLHKMEDLGADYICRGEGVRFMRQMLGVPTGQAVVHPTITAGLGLLVFRNYDFIHQPRIGLITSGFGCPGACEFCSTSAYYGHKHIPFLESGAGIYCTMLQMFREAGVEHFLIFEEDFMLYKKRVRELGELIRQDTEHNFTYGCFASIKSLSAYNMEELVAMGMEHVWIGVESREIHFRKREGRNIEEIFRELHALGVTTTGSMIFGLDHHTPEKLAEEVEFMASLNPSTFQLSNLMASEGTPLRKRLEQEQRIRAVGFKDADLYCEIIKHPRFAPGEISRAIFDGYEQIYNTLGPAVFRIIETWFTGYKNLSNSADDSLRRRSLRYAEQIKGTLPVLLSMKKYLNGNRALKKLESTLEEMTCVFADSLSNLEKRGELFNSIYALEQAKRENWIGQPLFEPDTVITYYKN